MRASEITPLPEEHSQSCPALENTAVTARTMVAAAACAATTVQLVSHATELPDERTRAPLVRTRYTLPR